jgi:hypothetical protein
LECFKGNLLPANERVDIILAQIFFSIIVAIEEDNCEKSKSQKFLKPGSLSYKDIFEKGELTA